MNASKYIFVISLLLIFCELSATEYHICKCDTGSDVDCINGDDMATGATETLANIRKSQ